MTVFMGAFLTAYLMMDNDLKSRSPYRAVKTPPLVSEAAVDSALDSLFEFEKGLTQKNSEKEQKRVPSQTILKKK